MDAKELKDKLASIEKELKELKKAKRRHKLWLAYLLWNK
jgi:hypothetical protein